MKNTYYVMLHEDNNAGITMIIHDIAGVVKYVHTYQGANIGDDKGYSFDGDETSMSKWIETDGLSLGADLKAFSEDSEDWVNWDGNEIGMWANGDDRPDESNPNEVDQEKLQENLEKFCEYSLRSGLMSDQAGELGDKLIKSGACAK